MKHLKTLLLVLAIPALSVSAYAGDCCKGGSKDKKAEKETTSVVSLGGSCGGGGCGDSKDKDKA